MEGPPALHTAILEVFRRGSAGVRSRLQLRVDDRVTAACAWGVWAVMLALALLAVFMNGRNMPVVEDWLMVPALTGNESNLAGWLWEQNAEHRIPLPKVILLSLLKLTGDFRAGMYFDVLLAGAVAAFMLLGVRAMRGGKTRLVDVFFPLTVLHLGNWENFFWSWQLTQAFPALLVLVLIVRAAVHPRFDDGASAVIGGIALLVLPLCGAPGLFANAFFLSWLVGCAALNWRRARAAGSPTWPSLFVFVCALGSVAEIGLYFIGYESAGYPPSPSLWFTLQIAARFIVMSTGLAALEFGIFSVLVVAGLVAASAAQAALSLVKGDPSERPRMAVLLLMLGMWVGFCCLVAASRAGFIATFPRIGSMSRYVLMFCPVIVISFLIWEAAGRARARRFVQAGMAVAMFVLAPYNYRLGSNWNYWYSGTYRAVETEVRAGTPVQALAKRFNQDLAHWLEPETLAERMRMLHDRRLTIFAEMPESAFQQ